LCWTDSSTPRLLGEEEARSLAGRATGSLRHQGSADQAALVPGPRASGQNARPAPNGRASRREFRGSAKTRHRLDAREEG
jgi:hypothetical protein